MALLGAAAAAAVVSSGLRVQRGGGSASRASEPPKTAMQARGGGSAPLVVIAGPPAAGKGTQCDKIKEKYGYVHISTGDILRENVKQGTDLGKKAKEYMDAGALVPSELIVDLVKDRLAKDDVKEKGCLLDGFPRAPDQAQAMADAGIAVDKFLVIKVPDETLVERGCGRRLDPETGEIYHMKFKPPPSEIVDRLVHRSDDQEEAIRERLKIYHAQIDGITPFFKEVVVDIDGTGKPDDVFTLVTGGLGGI
jgi:adenylate kinase